MTTNAIRCRIIAHLLKADHSSLEQIATLCQSQARVQLPIDLPEWLPIARAADLLHLHPAHLRRIAANRFPLLIDRRRLTSGQIGLYLNRSALQDIASATTRQPSATQES